MIPKTFKLDPQIATDLEKTAQREDRTQLAIVERALRDYFAKSRADELAHAEQAPAPEPANAA